MKPGVQKLIFDYFNCNIFDDYQIHPSIEKNIIETFTFAYNHHKTIKEINIDLEGSNIAELRERIRNYNKPFPIRLGPLKPLLQQEAFSITNGTIHGVARDIIAQHYKRRECEKCVMSPIEINNNLIIKLIEVSRIKRHNIKNHIYKKKFGAKAKLSPTLF